jgi:catechol 2,3-dioxygenase-like lactoylglutathione lyase family enzyme
MYGLCGDGNPAHDICTTLRHVGLTVADPDAVTAFFVALGLEVEGRTFALGPRPTSGGRRGSSSLAERIG